MSSCTDARSCCHAKRPPTTHSMVIAGRPSPPGSSAARVALHKQHRHVISHVPAEIVIWWWYILIHNSIGPADMCTILSTKRAEFDEVILLMIHACDSTTNLEEVSPAFTSMQSQCNGVCTHAHAGNCEVMLITTHAPAASFGSLHRTAKLICNYNSHVGCTCMYR